MLLIFALNHNYDSNEAFTKEMLYALFGIQRHFLFLNKKTLINFDIERNTSCWR